MLESLVVELLDVQALALLTSVVHQYDYRIFQHDKVSHLVTTSAIAARPSKFDVSLWRVVMMAHLGLGCL
jgi:hypothetical protein